VHVVVGNMLVACHQVGKSYQSINQVQSMVEANCYAQFQ
jgi:protein-arginine kinase activator protein McsA